MNLIEALQNVDKTEPTCFEWEAFYSALGLTDPNIVAPGDDTEHRGYWLTLTLSGRIPLGIKALYVKDALVGCAEFTHERLGGLFTFVSQEAAEFSFKYLAESNASMAYMQCPKAATLSPDTWVSNYYSVQSRHQIAHSTGCIGSTGNGVNDEFKIAVDFIQSDDLHDSKVRISYIRWHNPVVEVVNVRNVCFPLMQAPKTSHKCELNSPEDGYGSAVDLCTEHPDGTLWAGNGEYGSQVNYCPKCGFKAKTQVPVDLKDL